MSLYTLMTVQHTGTRSLYRLFDTNGIKRYKFGKGQEHEHLRYINAKDSAVAYGHPWPEHIKYYDRIKDESTRVTLERPYKDIKASWDERYNGTGATPTAFGVGLEEQYEYWLENVKPHSIVVDLYNPEKALMRLGLRYRDLGWAGKREEDMAHFEVAVIRTVDVG